MYTCIYRYVCISACVYICVCVCAGHPSVLEVCEFGKVSVLGVHVCHLPRGGVTDRNVCVCVLCVRVHARVSAAVHLVMDVEGI